MLKDDGKGKKKAKKESSLSEPMSPKENSEDLSATLRSNG